jgi:hypothetical protein
MRVASHETLSPRCQSASPQLPHDTGHWSFPNAAGISQIVGTHYENAIDSTAIKAHRLALHNRSPRRDRPQRPSFALSPERRPLLRWQSRRAFAEAIAPAKETVGRPQTPRPFSPPSIDTPHHPGRQNVPDVLLNPVAPADTPAAPIENIPSAVSFGWSSKGTITVVSGTQNWPVFPFHGGERDHANRLEACRVLATDTARSLQSGRWNARSEYAEILDQNIAWLPNLPGEGNFLLADAKTRIIREMFAAEQDFLPHPFTAELKVLLEQRLAVRSRRC